ncbi:hypothetical protein GTGU_02686 [Trabulsiella guamensis ATCC 49490]|uniref:DUF2509 family protein n=1 Tax=Trabulsiella guamensis ATCC 49490 TaxID=1005994 RepID=A0A085A7H0_9ENTR|nr:DUF2509 family protein [Trabulsiella guamensis]KFC06165.1 hypothetical protein GTGU_02686 [Trabulsiella guamensis ATCC 49490]
MNRENGISSLALVLLTLILGTLLLKGLSRQHQTMLSQVTLEQAALRDSARAQSALQWGRMQTWEAALKTQCQPAPAFAATVCLRFEDDNTGLLIARSGDFSYWQSVVLDKGVLRFSVHGWSDFCPRKESALCQIP